MYTTQLRGLTLLFVFVFLVSGCIGVNQEFKDIRDKVVENLSDDFQREIEFSVGPVGFFLASKFVQFAETEENIDELLSKISNIHLGVYKRTTNKSKPSLNLLRDLSYQFKNDNWSCIVRSLNENEIVGVFIKLNSSDKIENLFVISLNDDELVLLKLNGNIESIIDVIIREHVPSNKVVLKYNTNDYLKN